jgi:HK97 gp10 family phage protein
MPVEVKGLDKLFRNLDLIGKVPQTKEAKAVFHKAGLVVRKYARYFAPYDKKRKKGTHLRDAILVSDGPLAFTDVLVTVRYKRPGAPHAHLIEFGTVKNPAYPFMRPAAATSEREVEQIIHRGILALIKTAPK